MPATRLIPRYVPKPWGKADLPAPFSNQSDESQPGEKIGEIWFEQPNGEPLPLLVKYIFTSEKLSVQVHPNDEQARQRGLPNGKTECWYILDTEPGAALSVGLLKALSPDALKAAAVNGTLESFMDTKSVSPGDFFYIPAGTIHMIGAGITLVEVQQSSDITYRLYDYGRPRALHLEDAIAVSNTAPYPFPRRSAPLGGDAPLLTGETEPFSLTLQSLQPGRPLITESGLCWFIPVSGEGVIGTDPWQAGECWLIEGSTTIAAKKPGNILLSNFNVAKHR